METCIENAQEILKLRGMELAREITAVHMAIAQLVARITELEKAPERSDAIERALKRGVYFTWSEEGYFILVGAEEPGVVDTFPTWAEVADYLLDLEKKGEN